MRRRAAVLAGLLAVPTGCARERAAPPPAVRAVALPLPRPLFEPVSDGITLHVTERSYDAHVARVFVVRVEVARVRFALRPLPEHRFVPLMQEGDFDVATNAGFFEPDFSRSGLSRDHGEVRAPLRPRGGSGVFLVRGGRASVVPVDEGVPEDAELALQCGPRLVEPDGTLGIGRDDGRRAARTALCVREGGRVVDWVVTFREDGPGGPGLLQLATWLDEGLVPGEGGCEAALNLDGGPSTALAIPSVPTARRVPPGPVVEALMATSLERIP